MAFQFPSLLLIGLPLVLAPILIHLLNLRRQQRVEWAAMDYLLESEQRSRTWVNLKQWLLLAARLLAVLVAVLMLARPWIEGGLARWLTEQRVHHLVILDDSYSMSDRGSGEAAWERAKAAVERIAMAAQKNPRHRVSLVRGSAGIFDPDAEPESAVGPAEITGLVNRLRAAVVSESAVSLVDLLQRAAHDATDLSDDSPVVAYVISDFRKRSTEPADRFSSSMAKLQEVCSTVQIASCATPHQENLGITRLALRPGPQAAGVELTGEVEVFNFGQRPASNVTVRLTRDGQPLPAAQLKEVPARQSVVYRFPVLFNTYGDHALEAELEEDAVAIDNHRYFAAHFPAHRKLLLVDGSPGGSEGLAFATALRPADDRGDLSTGWMPTEISPRELTDKALQSAAAVLLLDVPQLPGEAAKRLHQFVGSGGGLLMLLGPSVDRQHYNRQLFRGDDTGVLPVRLDRPTQVEHPAERQLGDVLAMEHPLFRVFSGDRNGFLDLLQVDFYQAVFAPTETESDQLPAAPCRVIATLKHDATPLMLESTIGNGRVLTLLTSVSRPRGVAEGWSNLGRSPVFPVLVNEMAAYLAQPGLQQQPAIVGQPWPSDWQPTDPSRLPMKTARDGDQTTTQSELRTPATAGLRRRSPVEANQSADVLAINVDSQEGDLQADSLTSLTASLEGLGVLITQVDDLLTSDQPTAQAGISRGLGFALLLLLLFERWLAVLGSYHQPASAGRGA